MARSDDPVPLEPSARPRASGEAASPPAPAAILPPPGEQAPGDDAADTDDPSHLAGYEPI